MAHSVRTAISLPKEEYKRLEETRKKLGKSRSEVFQEALRQWFHRLEEKRLEALYVKGYRQRPEKSKDLEPFFRAGLASIAKDRW